MLTKKGQKLFDKWEEIYFNELDRLRKELHDPNYCEGWCIIDNADFIKDIDDEIGLLIFGYADGVIDILYEWKEDYEKSEDEEYIFGYTLNDIINLILAEGYIKED